LSLVIFHLSFTSSAMHYLAIGHIAKDITAQGWVFGGTVTYSARAAQALGCQVAVVTSSESDLDLSSVLPEIEIVRRKADRTTTFENIYTPIGRQQTLHAVADRLDVALADELRSSFLEPDIVHLAPIAQEVDENWIDRFPGALVGVTPQGWLRQWDQAGRVQPIGWASAPKILQRAIATVISIEDVGGDESIAQHWASITPILVVTRGERGCTVFVAGRPNDLPAPKVAVVDPTGAGDIFATAFFVWLRQTNDPIAAGRFANCIAAQSITRIGLDGVPSHAEIENCLEAT
jgi:sugar/nucleoside kinase (ribokinase family)